MIPQSNQSALVYTDNDFFTGAQAYGSAREFIQQSALAAPKESVNNMALGPLPWGLAVLGLLLGLHRRHRLFLIFSIFTALIFTIYMAGPAVFDVFRRLPFFKSFAGLSRYLAFLNFFLVAMAVLCAALCLRWARGVMRPVLIFCLVFGFLLNTAMLVRHEHNYWQKLMENKTELNFGELVEFVKANKSPGGRILVDARDESLRSHSMIFPLAARIPGVQDSNDPMHTQRYGRWLAAHNDLFGVDYSDYRSSRFFPSPSPYLRALGVRDYLYPPGSKIPAVVLGELQETGRYAGWRLMRDREPWPVAWPISDTSKLQTFPDLPEGWDVIKDLDEGTGNTWHMTIDNPGLATIVVISKPWYPGWTAKSDKMQTIPVGRAYGFLQSVPVEHGLQTISFHYQPYSFVLGWLLFICFSGAYSVILFQWVFLKSRVLLRHDLLFCLLPGLITCALRISTITGSPDRFFHRAFDLIIVCASAVILVFIIHLYKKRRVNPKTN